MGNNQPTPLRGPSSGDHYFLRDHLGSQVRELDAAGNIVSTSVYEPYGQLFIQGQNGSTGRQQNFGYTGQELDEFGGLQNYGARFYDPGAGRFISADSVVPNPLNIQSWNRFMYVEGDPIGHNDPTGHAGEDVLQTQTSNTSPNRTENELYEDTRQMDATEKANYWNTPPQPKIGPGRDPSYLEEATLYSKVGDIEHFSKTGETEYITNGDIIENLPMLMPQVKGATVVMGTVQKVAGAAKPLIFRNIPNRGKMLVSLIETSQGEVRFGAEAVVEGATLTLKKISAYPVDWMKNKTPYKGLEKEVFKYRRELVERAKASGFDTLKLLYERAADSTSAKPGKIVELTIPLRK
ncbi:MAG: RHS repeat-associated core domain-containing protein [Deltaproteobacteria bacterium]|nr:RHS repeat-associated core domain-containing protein [Deltaproteobacteria bacterium]